MCDTQGSGRAVSVTTCRRADRIPESRTGARHSRRAKLQHLMLTKLLQHVDRRLVYFRVTTAAALVGERARVAETGEPDRTGFPVHGLHSGG